MLSELYQHLRSKFIHWLIYEPPPTDIPPSDFNRLRYEIKPGDVLLVEGHSRVSRVIRTITQSPWTHAALYLGRLIDFEDEELPNIIRQHIEVKDNVRLVIEDVLDRGTVINHLSLYKHHHIRICRPIGITPSDVQLVLAYALKSLGQPYNVRQILDLARFLLPWSIMPRRWGSTLFRTSTGEPESSICSSLIAEAFTSVQFPVLPFVRPNAEAEGLELFPRNPYLFSPRDFDYSPYFEIIKYPLFNPEEPMPYYRRLPWTRSGMLHQDYGVLSVPKKKAKKKLRIFSQENTESAPQQSTGTTDAEHNPSPEKPKDEQS